MCCILCLFGINISLKVLYAVLIVYRQTQSLPLPFFPPFKLEIFSYILIYLWKLVDLTFMNHNHLLFGFEMMAKRTNKKILASLLSPYFLIPLEKSSIRAGPYVSWKSDLILDKKWLILLEVLAFLVKETEISLFGCFSIIIQYKMTNCQC